MTAACMVVSFSQFLLRMVNRIPVDCMASSSSAHFPTETSYYPLGSWRPRRCTNKGAVANDMRSPMTSDTGRSAGSFPSKTCSHPKHHHEPLVLYLAPPKPLIIDVCSVAYCRSSSASHLSSNLRTDTADSEGSRQPTLGDHHRVTERTNQRPSSTRTVQGTFSRAVMEGGLHHLQVCVMEGRVAALRLARTLRLTCGAPKPTEQATARPPERGDGAASRPLLPSPLGSPNISATGTSVGLRSVYKTTHPARITSSFLLRFYHQHQSITTTSLGISLSYKYRQQVSSKSAFFQAGLTFLQTITLRTKLNQQDVFITKRQLRLLLHVAIPSNRHWLLLSHHAPAHQEANGCCQPLVAAALKPPPVEP